MKKTAVRLAGIAGTMLVVGLWGCGGGGGGGDTSAVATISVPEGQAIGVNQTKYLTATAFDAQGNTISLSPSAFSWSVVTGQQFITFQNDGRAVGLAEGVPTVRASVNGVSSPATAVTVTPSAGGCTSNTYLPNYVDDILTPNTPNVSGSLRYWTKTPLRIRFVRDANWSQTLENLFRQGMTQWQNATSNGIAFQDTNDPNLDDIEVQFVPADQLPGQAIGITFATFDPNTLEMISARIQVANDLPTNTMSLTTSSHELGHALGIGGHSPHDTDLMYFQENGVTTTTVRDLNTLRTIYCDVFPRASTRSSGRAVTEMIVCPR